MRLILYKCDICNTTFKLQKIKNDNIEVYPSTLNSTQGHLEGQNISYILEQMEIEACPECVSKIEAKVKIIEAKGEIKC